MRRVPWAILIAVLVTIISSASVVAGTYYTWWISGARCYLTGGAYGEGYVKAKAEIQENGVSGTNYFHLVGRLQQWDGNSWNTIDWRERYSGWFPNDGVSYYFWKRFKLSVFDNSYFHRISIRYEWWDERPGGDVLLFARTRNGPYC